MMFISTSSKRKAIAIILLQWVRGETDAVEVHHWAEDRWSAGAPPELSQTDPRSIAADVLCQLDMLNHQWITSDDVPTILRFLEAPPGSESAAWAEWQAYWDSVDFEQRRIDLRGFPPYTAA